MLDERSGGLLRPRRGAGAGSAPVVLLCTSGTAAANYHPAVAEADLSAVPLIVLTADRPPELREIGAGQTIDQIKLYGSAVRWFCEVGTHDADDAGLLHFRATACRAFATAAGAAAARAGAPQPPFPRSARPRSPVPGAVDRDRCRSPLTGRTDGPLTAVLRFRAPPDPAEMERAIAASAERPSGC